MMYSPFTDLSVLAFLCACIIVGYKFVKPYIRVEVYKAAYYIGKLRQHAEKNKVNIDSEVVNILMSDNRLMKSIDPTARVKMYIEETDELFNEKKK